MVSFLSNPKERQCQRMFKIPHTSKVATHSTCLENPMSRGAWQAAVRGVAKSQTGLSLFTFMHWRRKWQPTPVFLSGESQRWGSLVGCRLWGRTGSDTTEATQQQQQEQQSSAQNSPSQVSRVREQWTAKYSSWIQKRQRNQRSYYQHPLDHSKSKRVPEKHLLLLY